MNKSIKRIVGLVSIAVLTSSLLVSGNVNASTLQATSNSQVESASTAASGAPYGTNPNGGVGKASTIKIDGDFSDWSDSMLIAQGVANDSATAFKGSHENCVLDDYSLYASWDDDNLYLGWQMVNAADTWWSQAGNGPLSDGGRIGDVPLEIGLSVDPGKKMTGTLAGGKVIWGSLNTSFTTPIDHIFIMSGVAGLGSPVMFTSADAEGNAVMPEKIVTEENSKYCKGFKTLGIKYAMAKGFLPSTMKTLNNPQTTADIYSASASWVDSLNTTKPHDKTLDSFYEMSIPLSALGIDKNYITTNGLGVIQLATRGESALDCLPNDPSMLDNAMGSYSKDPSSSKEKEDNDNITVPLANIGKIRNPADIPPTPDKPTITPPTPTITPPTPTITPDKPTITPPTPTITPPTPTITPDKPTTTPPTPTTTPDKPTVTPGTPTAAELDISKFSTTVSGPQTVGKAIKIYAEATGGTGSNKYQFSVNGKIIQDYSNKAYTDWKPTTAGKYNLTVRVRDASGTIVEGSTISYTITSDSAITPADPIVPEQEDTKAPTVTPGTTEKPATISTATTSEKPNNNNPVPTFDSNSMLPIAGMMVLGATSLVLAVKKKETM